MENKDNFSAFENALKTVIAPLNKSVETMQTTLSEVQEKNSKLEVSLQAKEDVIASEKTEKAELSSKLSDLEGKIEQIKFDGGNEEKKGNKLAEKWTNAFLNSKSHEEFSRKLETIKQEFALTDGQNIANNVDGGYLVPKVMSDQILEDITNELAPILGLTSQKPMGENLSINVTTSVPKPRRQGEGDTSSKSKSQYRQIELIAKRCSITVPATWEYLNWTIGTAQSRIMRDVAEGYSAKYLWELFNGVIASKHMEGILTNATVISTATTTETANAITYDDLVDLESSVKTNVDSNLRYVMDRRTLGAIRKLQDGAGNYIFTPGEKGRPSTINGIPVIRTGTVAVYNGTAEVSTPILAVPTAGVFTAGEYPIVLADFSGYIFGNAKGMTVMFDDKTGADEATFFWNFHAWNTGRVGTPDKFALLKIKASS